MIMRTTPGWPAVAAAALLAGMATGTALAAGFSLLSAEEYQSELKARAAPGASFVARAADLNAPTITVVMPNPREPIQPPVNIDIRFAAAEGATVNVSSLRILYGFLKLDVTRRILDAPGVQVSAAGLKANGAQLPSGSHKLIIEIADNVGRTARQVLEFTVK
jgi:hypothetical protein